MREPVLALLAGAVVGFLFSKLNLPTPAPPTISGVLGIAGVLLGAYLAKAW